METPLLETLRQADSSQEMLDALLESEQEIIRRL
jgi:hypothetical protein